MTGPAPSPGSYDIYSLLPFTQKDFTTAADVANRFTAAYGTYRFDEDPKAYSGRLQGMVTADLGSQLQRRLGRTGPARAAHARTVRSPPSEARLDSIRDIGKDQLIFLVTGTQHITKGGSHERLQPAVRGDGDAFRWWLGRASRSSPPT